MQRLFTIFCAGWLFITTALAQTTFHITTQQLKDKIKGGWAGQTIGVTYGAPVEFRYQGTMINDYHQLDWYDGLLKKSMIDAPGIYDDLYLDISFVEVFAREGLQAPVASHANAIAQAGYMLWHANQAARYNILHGITSPMSGHWLHNPHADCIDYQIESDFAGLMSPAMPNTASAISDRIGHIMNYGDGWYGGVFVGAMYALAFTSSDINYIVTEALKTIPPKTGFHDCIADVIHWHQQYPNDWKQTWFEIQKKWTDDIGCPDGVYSPFNIDAKVNAAYVVLGLLYGQGDMGKSMEIAARAGQDADCNPSTVGGILGVVLGYQQIPAYWKMGLADIEDMPFKYTHTSLNQVYQLSYDQALENIRQQGGKITKDQIEVRQQKPTAVQWEQGFTGMHPKAKTWIGKNLDTVYETSFTGNAFVITGEFRPTKGTVFDPGITAVAKVDLYIDEQFDQTLELPMSFEKRKTEIAWRYQLSNQLHRIKLVWKNPDTASFCFLNSLLVYGE